MGDRRYGLIQRRMLTNSRSVLAAAKNGSLTEMMVLGDGWTQPPGNIVPADAADVFLTHLDTRRIPSTPAAASSDRANLAFSASFGLMKIGPQLSATAADSPLIARLAAAWPGIFQWTAFFFATRVERADAADEGRRITLDVIAMLWHALLTGADMRAAMAATPGALELATRVWLAEEGAGMTADTPVSTSVLSALLKDADAAHLDRVLVAAGGRPEAIASVALGRVQRALRGPSYDAADVAAYLDCVCSLSRVPGHALRHALLSANAIWIVTGVLVKIAVGGGPPGVVDAMASAIVYLGNCIESTDGLTWVAQAVGAGLLPALCDCSSRFREFQGEVLEMVEDLIGRILPRYLVYRSVVEAVDGALEKIKNGPQRNKIERSAVGPSWRKFCELAEERMAVVQQSAATKGKHIICDNAKCRKVGARESVRRCSACLDTFYCSKECQAAAWKEGDHKTVCKLKQRERLEGKSGHISKRDLKFLHALSVHEFRTHLADLRAAAQRDFPQAPLSGLVVCIDQARVPATYGVRTLAGYGHPHLSQFTGTANAKARNDALIAKVRAHPERYTLVEITFACGERDRSLLRLAAWDPNAGGELVELEGETDEASMDGERVALGGVATNHLLESAPARGA